MAVAAKNGSRRWWKMNPPGKMHQVKRGDIACCDALDLLMCLRDETADIVFLDPPFNLGKLYGKDGSVSDNLSEPTYFRWMRQVLDRSISVLKKGGALYLYHLPKWALQFGDLLQEHLIFRHWIAVSMKGSFARGRYLYPAHYALLYFTKGEPAVFRRPKIDPLKCRQCHAYVRDYGGYKKYISNGINLSDIWDDLSPVRHKRYKHREANELPLQIPTRVVQISGRPNGVLVDPFAGSGTTLVAAARGGMRFIASDQVVENCELMMRRLSSILRSRR